MKKRDKGSVSVPDAGRERQAREATAEVLQTVPAEEAASAEQVVIETKESKKQSRVAKISFIWTIISMAYAIVSGATLIVNDWILAPYSYILLAMLCVYVVVFVAIVAYYAGDAKRGKKNVKTLKKLFGMFKIFTTLVFLIATAISMTGVVEAKGTGLWQWVVLCANIVVAAVQLSLKITLFVFKIVARKVGEHYTVKAQTYINGKLKEQKAKSYVMSKLYETEVTKEPERAQLAADGSVSSSAAVPQKAGREKVTRLKIDKENVKALAARAVEKLKPEDGGDNGAKK